MLSVLLNKTFPSFSWQQYLEIGYLTTFNFYAILIVDCTIHVLSYAVTWYQLVYTIPDLIACVCVFIISVGVLIFV